MKDDRVGFFSVSQRDFSGATQRVEPRTFISRWRLECSDRKVGNLCVPKKPVTYYLDPATPAWIKPWIKKGIEDWQPAFEAAGFSKGIIAADVPAEDPDFSGEDATVSMVRWLPSATENAVGPSLKDPRTGEILDADVQTYLNVMNLGRDWYFTQVGPLDKRTHKFPFPHSLAGRIMEYITAHEVGHTLGFQHNFKASSMYPTDSVRVEDVGREDGPHADAHGLLALQLRRAAGRRHRAGRPDPEGRSVRQVRRDVGLHAAPEREVAGSREGDARQVVEDAGHDSVVSLCQ